jgi:hypothetical protein
MAASRKCRPSNRAASNPGLGVNGGLPPFTPVLAGLSTRAGTSDIAGFLRLKVRLDLPVILLLLQ